MTYKLGTEKWIDMMNTTSYQISKSTPIIIYSGGFFGIGYANRLLEAGYNVIGILDNNPSKAHNSPVPVLKPEFSYNHFGDAFIWICLKDSLLHLQIARKLALLGYNRFLLLPIFLDSASAKQMIFTYNSFCFGNYEASIPYYNSLWNIRASDYILEENCGFVTVLVHKNHVYSIYTDKDTNRSNPFSLSKVTKDNPLNDEEFRPLQFFENNYRNIFSNDRNDLYQLFESSLLNFSDFFINGAAYAQLSRTSKYWYIVDGYHRSSYLLLKGFKSIPLKVKREEWDIYFNEEKAQNLMDYCKESDYIPMEINHPAFLRFPVKEEKADKEFLSLYSNLGLLHFGG